MRRSAELSGRDDCKSDSESSSAVVLGQTLTHSNVSPVRLRLPLSSLLLLFPLTPPHHTSDPCEKRSRRRLHISLAHKAPSYEQEHEREQMAPAAIYESPVVIGAAAEQYRPLAAVPPVKGSALAIGSLVTAGDGKYQALVAELEGSRGGGWIGRCWIGCWMGGEFLPFSYFDLTGRVSCDLSFLIHLCLSRTRCGTQPNVTTHHHEQKKNPPTKS